MANISNPCCIYEGREVWIYELYTVNEGKQINIPQKVELFHKLSKEKKLFCPCGCGRNYVLVAGDKMLRRQHFRLYPNQHEFDDVPCKAVSETYISFVSKTILKCWLDYVFDLKDAEVKARVPINSIADGVVRRYEFTHYVPSRNFGLCYERLDANLNDEKLDVLSESMDGNYLCIIDGLNRSTSQQYPEYVMKSQRMQGFCIFMKVNEDSTFENAEFVVEFQIDNHKGYWEHLIVAEGKLDEFGVDADGVLLHNGVSVPTLVDTTVKLFIERENAEIAAERERQRIEDELIEKEKRECQERLAAARKREEEKARVEKRKELQQKLYMAQNRKQNLAIYLNEHPKLKCLYEFIQSLSSLTGYFDSMQEDGRLLRLKETVEIKWVKFIEEKNLIHLRGVTNVNYYLFLSDTSSLGMGKSTSGIPYAQIDLSKVMLSEVVPEFRKQYFCGMKNKTEVVYCGADIMCPFRKDNGICGMEKSQCSFRTWNI